MNELQATDNVPYMVTLLSVINALIFGTDDLRLKWGVKAADWDKTDHIFELYAIRSTERNGRAPLEGDVITDAHDTFDQYSKPAVSMSMNTDGARRWAVMTKNNIGRAIAIVLDGYV